MPGSSLYFHRRIKTKPDLESCGIKQKYTINKKCFVTRQKKGLKSKCTDIYISLNNTVYKICWPQPFQIILNIKSSSFPTTFTNCNPCILPEFQPAFATLSFVPLKVLYRVRLYLACGLLMAPQLFCCQNKL